MNQNENNPRSKNERAALWQRIQSLIHEENDIIRSLDPYVKEAVAFCLPLWQERDWLASWAEYTEPWLPSKVEYCDRWFMNDNKNITVEWDDQSQNHNYGELNLDLAVVLDIDNARSKFKEEIEEEIERYRQVKSQSTIDKKRGELERAQKLVEQLSKELENEIN